MQKQLKADFWNTNISYPNLNYHLSKSIALIEICGIKVWKIKNHLLNWRIFPMINIKMCQWFCDDNLNSGMKYYICLSCITEIYSDLLMWKRLDFFHKTFASLFSTNVTPKNISVHACFQIPTINTCVKAWNKPDSGSKSVVGISFQ